MARPRKKEAGKGKRTRSANREEGLPRKRSNRLEGVKFIRADDYELIRRFMTEHGKIVPSRLTGVSAKQQRRIKRIIRRLRVLGSVP